MNQLFELKTIQSEDDLPKESGRYWVELKGSFEEMERWQYFPEYPEYPKEWMDKVRSYFSPVSVEKETVYVPVSVMEELPKSDGFYFTLSGENRGNNWFRNGKWIDEILNNKPSKVTHWLKQSEVLIVKQ